jgi:formate--tetrahydrofolate ligase
LAERHPLSSPPRPILDIAETLGFQPDEIYPHGRFKAKITLSALTRLRERPIGRYVLVTAMNPTPLGEGKTTTAIGLAMALERLGHRAVVTLRQPSIGPIFGLKGGGTGGGRSRLFPADEINLHCTGDSHAVTAAHNLLAAFLDNHLFHGNDMGLDPERITWPRAVGVSDRALRAVTLEGEGGRQLRRTQFVLTEASEVMAILALATDYGDLRRRLGRIVVGATKDGRLVTADDLRCAGAMASLLRDALQPNLVQTNEGTPAFVHAGPFGNIAHGNSSILADALALRCADYVVTEAGFGSELGAEKFFDIKCRVSGLRPRAAVVVATLRALKLHGGGGPVKSGQPLPASLTGPNRDALTKGLANLAQHIANVRAFGVPAVVAVNAFPDDPADELRMVTDWAVSAGARGAAVSAHFSDGGEGARALAMVVVEAGAQPAAFTPLYADEQPIKEKIEVIAKRLYGAAAVRYEAQAEAHIDEATGRGYARLPVCMTKTPLSLSHDPRALGCPSGFTLPIQDVQLSAGAGFLTVLCSGVQLLPGLPKRPIGERMDLEPETGTITGLL